MAADGSASQRAREASATSATSQQGENPNQLRALVVKTALLQSRQRLQCFCSVGFCPIMFLSLIFLMQFLLMDLPVSLWNYRKMLDADYKRFVCGNVSEIMQQACVARGSTDDFGTAAYPVGLHGFPGCHFCEENERNDQCRKYPDGTWAYS